jgi:hypothetical protein
VPAVDQDAKFHPPWASVIHKGIQGGTRSSARVKDVVHKDHRFALHGKPWLDDGLLIDTREVIAVQSDVQCFHRWRGLFDLRHLSSQPLSQWDSTAPDSHQNQPFQAVVALQDFVRQAHHRAVNL